MELAAYFLLCSERSQVNLFLHISNTAYRRLLQLIFNILGVNELQNVHIFFFFLTYILFKNYKFCECLIWTTYTRLGNYFKWFSPELCSDFEQAWRNRFVFISSEVFRRPIFFWGLQGEWILMYLSGSDWCWEKNLAAIHYGY